MASADISASEGGANVAMTRRTLVGGLALAGGAQIALGRASGAQESTPSPVVSAAPGYLIARVRVLPTGELNQAIYPHVMHRFLPANEAAPGYAGYIFAFHDDDPGASITATFTADEAGAEASDAVSQEFVSGLDPRFAVETPVAEQGPLSYFTATTRPATELAPFYHGYKVAMRRWETAPGQDPGPTAALANEELRPMVEEMEGFILYAWMLFEGGGLGLNIWETAEHLAAGDEVIGGWVAEHAPDLWVGGPVEAIGTVGYASIPGLV
jgi:hypothetical protein